MVLAVLDGRADLGIFADRTPAMGLQHQSYRRDRRVLVVPSEHPLARRRKLAFADTVAYDFVSLTQSTSLAQRLALESQNSGTPLRIRIQVRSYDAMCQMVAAGLGIAVLPQVAAQPLAKALGLRVIELTDAWVERELLLGVRDLGGLARPARTLLDHLVA